MDLTPGGGNTLDRCRFLPPVSVAPSFKSGDQFRIDVTRVRDNSARPEQNSRSTTPIDVRVISVTADGVSIDWIPGSSRIEGPLAQNPLLTAASSALNGLLLRLTLNAKGEVTGLANQDEILTRVQAAVDTIVRGMLEQAPDTQREAMQAVLAQVLSPPTLLAAMTRDAQTYFGLAGVSLAVGQTGEATLEQPNPLGGDPLPATYRITMESAAGDSAVVTTATAYDTAALLRSVRALAEQGGAPIPESELAALPPLQMSDEGRYVLDRATGLMREIVVTRRFGLGPEQRIDRWEFRLVRTPQR